MSARVRHYDIFDHWKDKVILKNGKISDLSDTEGEEVVKDWGEPMCWACGKPVVGDYEKSCEGERDLVLLWNDKKVVSKLNRCHIIPKALGGENTADNLFLLCEDCHWSSPDTINPSSFFRWVYTKRQDSLMGHLSAEKMISLMNVELNQRGYPDFFEIVSWLDGNCEISDIGEFSKGKINSHMNKIALSSLIAVACDWLIDNCLNHLLDV